MPAKKYMSRFMNMSIPTERYEKILNEWDSKYKIQDDISFTEWVTQSLENVMVRRRFLSKVYPHLKVITTTSQVFIIENTKTNDIVKVSMDGVKLVCTAPKNQDQYIMFACLHPLFALK